MNPEELAQIRANSDQVDGIVLTYEEWPENDADCQLLISLAYNVPDLIAYIDSQAAQISALKEKLVEERAQVLAGKGNLIWEPLPDDDRPDGLYPALVIRGKAYWRTVAHQQIEAEMVGVEWE